MAEETAPSTQGMQMSQLIYDGQDKNSPVEKLVAGALSVLTLNFWE